MGHTISSQIATINATEAVIRTAPAALNAVLPESDAAALARSEIRARASRGRFFRPTLFSDPAWDILLELFSAEHEGRLVSISGVGLTSNIPQTTAHRWINVLEREGLVERTNDPRDGRRTFLSLSRFGLLAMYQYFQASARASLLTSITSAPRYR